MCAPNIDREKGWTMIKFNHLNLQTRRLDKLFIDENWIYSENMRFSIREKTSFIRNDWLMPLLKKKFAHKSTEFICVWHVHLDIHHTSQALKWMYFTHWNLAVEHRSIAGIFIWAKQNARFVNKCIQMNRANWGVAVLH